MRSDTTRRPRVAVVTGAASGLGRAVARRLAEEGCAVACLDLDTAGAQQTANGISAAGGQACALHVDVAAATSVARAVEEAEGWLDGVDVVVNAAGIGSVGHSHQVAAKDWDAVLAVNLTGTFLMCRQTLPALLRFGGNVVNVASVAGLGGWRYMAAYAASKGGVIALTKSLAAEYAGRGVRFNCIAPGSIDTPLARRLAPPADADAGLLRRRLALVEPARSQPEEVAGAVAYLASSEARFITGSVMVIDGGASL